ncbi:MAG: DCC1-like thiol-disulfide oxidoreductase family protein [Bryobacteraceae bacterium]
MHPVRWLTVLYDPDCGLCTAVKDWLKSQEADIRLQLVPAGSTAAKRLFPSLTGREELIVVNDRGGVYRDTRAWIMVLFALRKYRGLSKRLASPALMPLARQAFLLVSSYRSEISTWLGMLPEAQLADRLRQIGVPHC